MQDRQSPNQVAAAVLRRLEPILQDEAPDWVIVQGDTTSVMAASLAAFHARAKIAHVEAGLRTFDKRQPFPEEINRQVVSLVADLHFAPTERARRNLLDSGIPAKSVHLTGNTVIDSLQWVAAQPFEPRNSPLAGIAWNKRIVLVTAHRRENFGRPIMSICEALRRIASTHPDDVEIVYPVHPNPSIYAPVHATLDGLRNVRMLPPLDYQPLIYLLTRCHIVLSDSGGIQEEAPTIAKPVLVLRDVTERPEGVEAGVAKLVGTDCDRIVESTERLLNDHAEYSKMAQGMNPYGDGHASERILEALVQTSQ
jgi:UDP-N-acetylglucosamine 2-epimerase (non-hydrolysing)